MTWVGLLLLSLVGILVHSRPPTTAKRGEVNELADPDLEAPEPEKPVFKLKKLGAYLLEPTLQHLRDVPNWYRSFHSLDPTDFDSGSYCLKSHHIYTREKERKKLFPNQEILAFVTPWNKKGYMMAQKMIYKLDWVVPVWYQIQRDTDQKLVILGRHDEKLKWLKWMKKHNQECSVSEASQEQVCTYNDLKIVPRVVLETQLSTEKDAEEVANRLFELYTNVNAQSDDTTMLLIDGFTLEASQYNIAMLIPYYLKKLLATMSIVYVLPPIDIPAKEDLENENHRTNIHMALMKLSEAVDRIALVTYDKNKNGGAIAPIAWQEGIVRNFMEVPNLKSKLLLGLPLYGWRTGREDMTAEKMVIWLHQEKGVAVDWNKRTMEHEWKDEQNRKCSYPSPQMLQLRVEMANAMGIAGLSLWELGQSMAGLIDAF